MYSIPIGFRFRDATRCQRLWLIAFCAASQTAARAASATCGTLTLQLQFNRNFSAQIEEFSPRHFFYCFYLMRFTVSSLFFALRFVSFRSFIVLNDLSFLFHSLSHSLFLFLSPSCTHSPHGAHIYIFIVFTLLYFINALRSQSQSQPGPEDRTHRLRHGLRCRCGLTGNVLSDASAIWY